MVATTQAEYFPAPGGQLGDCLGNGAFEISYLDPRVALVRDRTRYRCRTEARERFVEGKLRPLLTQTHDGAVARRAVQVGIERAPRFPEVAHLPDTKEKILHDLLRSLVRAQQAFRESDEIVAVRAEHCLERAIVSRSNARNP